jgi:hypothetical protein
MHLPLLSLSLGDDASTGVKASNDVKKRLEAIRKANEKRLEAIRKANEQTKRQEETIRKRQEKAIQTANEKKKRQEEREANRLTKPSTKCDHMGKNKATPHPHSAGVPPPDDKDDGFCAPARASDEEQRSGWTSDEEDVYVQPGPGPGWFRNMYEPTKKMREEREKQRRLRQREQARRSVAGEPDRGDKKNADQMLQREREKASRAKDKEKLAQEDTQLDEELFDTFNNMRPLP